MYPLNVSREQLDIGQALARESDPEKRRAVERPNFEPNCTEPACVTVLSIQARPTGLECVLKDSSH